MPGEPTVFPTAIPSALPTATATLAPTAYPSAVPSALPTTEGTFAPTVEGTSAPTAGPTAVPTGPTFAPTRAPTAKPSRVPTKVPTPGPTPQPGDPTLKPTPAPTVVPTARPTEVPTAKPTVQTSPILSFTSDISLGGLTEPVMDSSSQQAVVDATAQSMGVSANTVSFVGATFTPSARRALRASARASQISLFATLYDAVATTKVDLPIDTMGTTNATELYLSLTKALTDAVSDGSFTSNLQSAAVALNATVLASADATGVTNSAPTVNNDVYVPASDDEGDSLSGGAIAGIVIGVLVGVALLGALVYYFAFAGGSGGGKGAQTHQEVFSTRSHIEIAL